MNKEIRIILESDVLPDEYLWRLDEINAKLDVILSAIAIPQQLAADIAGIHRDTILNKAKKGELDILQKDGSSLNFVTLKQVSKLKIKK